MPNHLPTLIVTPHGQLVSGQVQNNRADVRRSTKSNPLHLPVRIIHETAGRADPFVLRHTEEVNVCTR